MAIEKDDRSKMDALLRELGQLKRSVITVGVQENAKPHIDENGKAMDMAELAAIHEFGDAEIPERSFLRSTFEVRDDDWEAAVEKQVAKIVQDKQTVKGMLIFTGVLMSSDVKKTILSRISPALAPMTLAKRMEKGKHGGGTVKHADDTTPLKDTNQLFDSITFEVGNA